MLPISHNRDGEAAGRCEEAPSQLEEPSELASSSMASSQDEPAATSSRVAGTGAESSPRSEICAAAFREPRAGARAPSGATSSRCTYDIQVRWLLALGGLVTTWATCRDNEFMGRHVWRHEQESIDMMRWMLQDNNLIDHQFRPTGRRCHVECEVKLDPGKSELCQVARGLVLHAERVLGYPARVRGGVGRPVGAWALLGHVEHDGNDVERTALD